MKQHNNRARGFCSIGLVFVSFSMYHRSTSQHIYDSHASIAVKTLNPQGTSGSSSARDKDNPQDDTKSEEAKKEDELIAREYKDNLSALPYMDPERNPTKRNNSKDRSGLHRNRNNSKDRLDHLSNIRFFF